MRVVGLTGGIASGKSTFAGLLRARGAPVVDADALARAVVGPGSPTLARIAEAFGPGALRPDGTLDRPWMARRVFADVEALSFTPGKASARPDAARQDAGKPDAARPDSAKPDAGKDAARADPARPAGKGI